MSLTEIYRLKGLHSRKGYEYKVCWKKTWLLERELGNAQELLRTLATSDQIHGRILLTDPYEMEYLPFITVQISKDLRFRLATQRVQIM